MYTYSKMITVVVLVFTANIIKYNDGVMMGFRWTQNFIIFLNFVNGTLSTIFNIFSKNVYFSCYSDFEYTYKFTKRKPFSCNKNAITKLVLPQLYGPQIIHLIIFGNNFSWR